MKWLVRNMFWLGLGIVIGTFVYRFGTAFVVPCLTTIGCVLMFLGVVVFIERSQQ